MFAVMAWLVAVAVLAWGMVRQGRERNVPGMMLVAVLSVAFFASLALAFAPPPRWFLAAPEFLVIAVAARIWNDRASEGARIVALLGMGKLGLRFAWSEGWLHDHTIYAATLNGAFLVQCLIAGGMLNGIGVAIADRWRALFRWSDRDSWNGAS